MRAYPLRQRAGEIRDGFTLVEIMVIVAIIVILIALLVPALSKAMAAAQKAVCLAHQRTQGQSAIRYALDYDRKLPHARTKEEGIAHAYDLRTTDMDANTSVPGVVGIGYEPGAVLRYELGIGLLIVADYLPTTNLGKVVHCPSFDNQESSGGGHCMDVRHGWGFGASWWEEEPNGRIISGYNYRALSYANTGKGTLKMSSKTSGAFVMLMDTPDTRWRGRKGAYGHADGYGVMLMDASAHFFSDPEYEVDAILTRNETREGVADGKDDPSRDEEVYDWVKVQR